MRRRLLSVTRVPFFFCVLTRGIRELGAGGEFPASFQEGMNFRIYLELIINLSPSQTPLVKRNGILGRYFCLYKFGKVPYERQHDSFTLTQNWRQKSHLSKNFILFLSREFLPICYTLFFWFGVL